MSAFSVISACDSRPSEDFHFHTHHHAELIYIPEGKVLFELSDSTQEAAAGDLLIVSRMEKHGVRPLCEPCRQLCIGISYDVKADQDTEHRLLSVIHRPRGNRLLHFNPADNPIEPLMASLVREFSERTELSEQMLSSLTTQLLVTLYRSCPQANRSTDGKRIYSKILLIQQYIDDHFTEDITVEQIAKSNYISSDYLTKCFFEVTGYTPKQYITTNRLVFARKLLRTTDDTVDSIAFQCGFFNVNNFIRSFKQYYGETPGKYYKTSHKG